MATKRFRPRTPEEQARYNAQHERDLHHAAECLEQRLDAMARGEDPTKLTPPPRDDAPPPLPSVAVGRLRADGWTAERQRAFILHLAHSACVSHACAHVGLSKQSAYALRNAAPASVFAIAWAAAVRMGRERLLDEATERALEGRKVAVRYRGEVVGTEIVPNDRLAMFLLSHTPEPAHPVLSQADLCELFPAMLQEIDALLPSALQPARLADRKEDHA